MSSPYKSLSGGGDVNRGLQLLPIYWTQFAVALIFVVLRFYARFSIRAVGWDDWAMAITMVLSCQEQNLCVDCDTDTGYQVLDTAATVVQTFLVKQDPLVSVDYETMDRLSSMMKLYLILQVLTTMAVAIGRTSVAILLIRLVGPNLSTRYLLYFSIASTLFLSSAYSILIFLQCSPLERIWDVRVPGGYCWGGKIILILAVVVCGISIRLPKTV